MSDRPPVPAHRPPGYDENDPYEGEDLSTYPEWWRRAIKEFRAHGMRPYRPSRFADQEYTRPLVSTLEQELNVDIQIQAIDPHEVNEWEILVDGTPIETVTKVRESEGYSLYQIDSDRFESLVRDAATD